MLRLDPSDVRQYGAEWTWLRTIPQIRFADAVEVEIRDTLTLTFVARMVQGVKKQ